MKTEKIIKIVEGKGAYLKSDQNDLYLDAISSWWVNLHGHTHPYIVAKINEQLNTLEHVLFAGFTHPPAQKLAQRLLALLPFERGKVFFSDNGSTACEVALKMALAFFYTRGKKRKRVLCLKGGYHGDTFGSMSASSKHELNRPFWSHLFEVIPISFEEGFHGIEALMQQEEVACFIFEPLILGVGGMKIYQKESLEALLKLCKKYGVITIADEAMTAFGRVGSLFAIDQLAMKPDMICLSKGLTGGFLTCGVTICQEFIYEAFLGDDLSNAFLHGHSYTANPLACASANASLDLLLEPSCALKRELIAESHATFVNEFKDHPKLKRCGSLGTILSLEYGVVPSYFSSIRDKLYHFFLERKILLRPLGNVLYVMPPYCIEKDELEFIYENIVEGLEL